MNIEPAYITLFGIILTIMVGIVGTIIGIYVSTSNKQTNHEARITELENKAGHVFVKLDDHENKIQDLLLEIKESVYRVETKIGQLK